MGPAFQALKCRLYAAWALAEAAAILNGLGVYPKAAHPRVGRGPTSPLPAAPPSSESHSQSLGQLGNG